MKYAIKKVQFLQAAWVLFFVTPLLTGLGFAATAEDWVVAESTLVEKVDHGLAGRAVTVRFAELTDPRIPRPSTDILVGGSASGNLFSGNLLTTGSSGLRFRVAGDGTQPAAVDVMIYREDKYERARTWVHTGVSVSDQAGEWTVIRIPLDPSKGWSPTHIVASRYTVEETWAMDLADVDAIFVRISRAGMESQTFSLADFELVGSGDGAITEPANLTLIEDYFGVSNFEEIDKTLDSNGDGMSDYHCLLAGLDPRDPGSVFAAEAGLGAEGHTISWPGVLYGNYRIMRSTDLKKFTQIGAKQAAFTGTQTWVDPSPVEGSANFYKVVKY